MDSRRALKIRWPHARQRRNGPRTLLKRWVTCVKEEVGPRAAKRRSYARQRRDGSHARQRGDITCINEEIDPTRGKAEIPRASKKRRAHAKNCFWLISSKMQSCGWICDFSKEAKLWFKSRVNAYSVCSCWL